MNAQARRAQQVIERFVRDEYWRLARERRLRGLHDEVPVDIVAVLGLDHPHDLERVPAAVDQIPRGPRRCPRTERAEILTGLAEQPVRRHDRGGYR